jgi:hypothetical protein
MRVRCTAWRCAPWTAGRSGRGPAGSQSPGPSARGACAPRWNAPALWGRTPGCRRGAVVNTRWRALSAGGPCQRLGSLAGARGGGGAGLEQWPARGWARQGGALNAAPTGCCTLECLPGLRVARGRLAARVVRLLLPISRKALPPPGMNAAEACRAARGGNVTGCVREARASAESACSRRWGGRGCATQCRAASRIRDAVWYWKR